jgi:hypothetical protein
VTVTLHPGHLQDTDTVRESRHAHADFTDIACVQTELQTYVLACIICTWQNGALRGSLLNTHSIDYFLLVFLYQYLFFLCDVSNIRIVINRNNRRPPPCPLPLAHDTHSALVTTPHTHHSRYHSLEEASLYPDICVSSRARDALTRYSGYGLMSVQA